MRKEELKAYPNPSKHKSFADSIAEDPQYNDRREDLSWWNKRKTESDASPESTMKWQKRISDIISNANNKYPRGSKEWDFYYKKEVADARKEFGYTKLPSSAKVDQSGRELKLGENPYKNWNLSTK